MVLEPFDEQYFRALKGVFWPLVTQVKNIILIISTKAKHWNSLQVLKRLKSLLAILTHDCNNDRLWDLVSLDVAGLTRVTPGLLPGDGLKDEALICDDHSFLSITQNFFTLKIVKMDWKFAYRQLLNRLLIILQKVKAEINITWELNENVLLIEIDSYRENCTIAQFCFPDISL